MKEIIEINGSLEILNEINSNSCLIKSSNKQIVTTVEESNYVLKKLIEKENINFEFSKEAIIINYMKKLNFYNLNKQLLNTLFKEILTKHEIAIGEHLMPLDQEVIIPINLRVGEMLATSIFGPTINEIIKNNEVKTKKKLI